MNARTDFRRPVGVVRRSTAQPSLLGVVHLAVGAVCPRILRFPGGRLPARAAGAAMASDLRPVGGDPLQRRRRRDPRRACLWRIVRRLGPQDHDDHRHLYLRRELRPDGHRAERLVGGFCRTAILYRGRADGRSHPVLGDPGRTDADPAPDLIDELLSGLCLGRRLSRFGGLRRVARADRLARGRDARHGAGNRRRADLVLRARIGALACGKRPLFRRARGSRQVSRRAAPIGAVADPSAHG